MHDSQFHAIDSMILRDVGNISDWDDLTIDAELKRELEEQLLWPLVLPAAYHNGIIQGILLHGVPGCGKTYLCRAIAKSAGRTFFNVECSSLISIWQGESEK